MSSAVEINESVHIRSGLRVVGPTFSFYENKYCCAEVLLNRRVLHVFQPSTLILHSQKCTHVDFSCINR